MNIKNYFAASNEEIATMNDTPTSKPAFTPKQRFPEFHDAGEWKYSPLGSVCNVLNNRRRPISSNERTPGPYPYYGASGVVDYVRDFIFDEKLLLVGEDGAKWGAFERTAFIVEGRYWVNNHAHVLKPFAANDALLENFLTMSDLSPFVTGAAPPKLTLGKLLGIPIPLPPSATEQQKIADCLSSLDAVIAAASQKLDALQRHKKALMQQLFPRAGETVPRLRFPEFRDEGEWKKKKLGDISVPVVERVKQRNLTPVSISAGIGFVPQIEKFGRDISGNQYQLYTLVRDGDFVYNKGNSLKFPQGCVYLLQGWGEVAAPNVFISFRLKGGYSNGFFQHCFEKNIHGVQLTRHITSSARSNGLLNISKDAFFGIEIPTPTLTEQQRIADCLSSLDDLITTQTHKCEGLQMHKKGLMQQLFPAVENEA